MGKDMGDALQGGPMAMAGGQQMDRGQNQSAWAAHFAAQEQQAEAKRQYDLSSGIVNKATVEGLASFDRDIANQEKNLSRQESLIGQIDPTIIEASQQALKLLRGETSSALNPLQNQRNMARQKLVNNLREQLGPGAETSTAGIQALNRFDSESSNIFGQAQQQALGQLGSTAGQFNSVRPDMYREIMGLSGLGQGKTNLQYNQANSLMNFGQGMMNTAGAGYTHDLLEGQYEQARGQQLYKAGAQQKQQVLSFFTGMMGGGQKKPEGGGDSGGSGGSGYAGGSP